MITAASIEIEASPSVVWDIFTDVERWPEWTDSVTRLVALDGPGLDLGKRFEIKQPRLPKLVWEVTEVTEGASWTWVQRSPGGMTIARHEVVPMADGRTQIRQELEQRGFVGALVGRLMLRTTKRYLELEGLGLKKSSESARDLRGPAS